MRTKDLTTGETLEAKKKRARAILRALRKLYSDADCALHHDNPLELLVATILSAQCTDEAVNKVTPILFKQYPDARAIAKAPAAKIEKIIHATGFFRQKTKSIQGSCRKLMDDFDGCVPDSMDELVTLPGVARKTANVVLGSWFGKNEGVVVDTHVGRLATRLALTWTSRNAKDAVKIERDLIEIIPRSDWTYVGHALIFHGRRVCPARKPECDKCSLARYCPSAGTFD